MTLPQFSRTHAIGALVLCISGCANWDTRSEDYFQPDDDTPPALNLEAPTDGSLYALDEEVRLVGTASDLNTPWDQLVVTADSDRDGNILTTNPGSDGRFDVALPLSSDGAHNLTVTVIDGSALQTSTVVTFAWGQNLPPSAPEISLKPKEVDREDSLQAIIVTPSEDPEGDAIEYLYTWSVDGVVQESFTTDTIPEGNLFKDQVWSVEVVATDGVNFSDAVSAETTVEDSNPTVTVTITPSSPTPNDTLTCSWEVVDPDGDEIELVVAKWSVNDAYIQDGSLPFSGDFEVGDTVKCLVVATTAAGPEEGSAEVTIVGGAGVPVVQSVVIVGDLPVKKTSSEVRCDVGSSDPDGDPVTNTVNWYVNGTLAAANTETADPSIYVNGDELQCGATASDGANTSNEKLSAVEIVLNSRPSQLSSVSISPASASVGDTLTCVLGDTSIDPDGDTVTYEYYWFINGSKDTAQNQNVAIDTSSYSEGDGVQCAVRPHDGVTNGIATYSSTVTLTAGQGGTATPADADLAIFGSATNGRLGRAVTNIGDLDADGKDELALTGYGYDNNRGAAMLFLGSTLASATSNLTDNDADGAWQGEAQGDYLGAGENIGSASINSDGRPDIITASHKNDSSAGKIYVHFSSDFAQWNTQYVDDAASFMVTGDASKAQMVGFGFGAGDIDGDGLAELFVGAPRADVPSSNAGYVGVFLGSTMNASSFGDTETLSDADYLISGMDTNDGLGDGELTVIGDIDGDGYDEVAIGGTNMNSSSTNSVGSLYLVSGGDLADGKVESTAFVALHGANASDDFGYSASSPGDLDGDGTPDLFVGARYGDEATTDAGAVYFYYGDSNWSGSLSTSDADASWGDDTANALFSKHILTDADYDGDGTNDILLGAQSYGASKTGRAYLLSGADHSSWTTGADISSQAGWTVEGDAADNAGVMSAFIDANDDGDVDIAVGADGDDNGATQGGSILFFFGD